eukprot:TRINITY_DN16750_c1_g1_i1.p1 TRINITY_DN16750_c1_g1~~TRINITY_DN16750_c1_g1_i1.p1  ORF type:complete len:131 (-),score=16.88 TRINITY_DN16750_c1_g1_i1:70-429(-)
MEVVNEVDRFFLSSQSCRVNALLRDVGFTPVACDACNGQITSGFFVVVMGCRHRFHVKCFEDHFKDSQVEEPDEKVAPKDSQAEASTDAGACNRRCPPLVCPSRNCAQALVFGWARQSK